MQKVTQIPSCLTDSAEASLKLLVKVSESSLTPSEGYRRVCHSAKLVGLSIAMSATGMVFSHQATATTGNPQAVLSDLANSLEASGLNPNISATEAPQSSLQVPTAKVEPQHKESSLKAKKEFSSQYAAIAAPSQSASEQRLSNSPIIQVPPLNSQIGASIPSLQSSSAIPAVRHSSQLNSALVPVRPHSPTASLKSTGRNTIKTASKIIPVPLANSIPEANAVADVADVSQPLQVIPPPENTLVLPRVSTHTNTANSDSVIPKKPLTVAAGNFETPIPIVVPTPETQQQTNGLESEFKTPIPISTNPEPVPLAKKQENTPSSQSLAVSKLEAIGTNTTPPQGLAKVDSPILIPVVETETAALPNYSQPQKTLSPLAVKEPAINHGSSSDQGNTQNLAVYTIQPGDTLNSIAEQYHLSSADLIKANHLSDPNLIRVNQNLLIPAIAKGNSVKAVVSPQLIASNTSHNSSSVLPASVELAAPKISAPLVEQPAKTIPIAVDAPSSTYMAQLKTDVANLQQTYRSPSPSLSTPVPQVVPVANNQKDLNEEINPEWGQRVAPNSQIVNSSAPNRSLPRAYNAPQTSLSQLQQRYRPDGQSVGVNPSQQIIGSAPIDVEEYNDSFNTPVGQEVNPAAPNTLTEGYIWPARGVFTSGYGRRWGRMHRGIDIAAPIGTPIMASASGEVITAGWNSGGFGNLVKLRHADGSVTLYAHNSRILVRTGQFVAQGQQIAEMGSTGRSTGPHLHFEIRPNGTTAVNPVTLLASNRS
ncbi:MAG: peptidoglycan DD-metalloendopeptidase family protein [Snowella sp.]|nr:peptidoglycan DD-metalloendopeptidase family protein [Snowella sp.]